MQNNIVEGKNYFLRQISGCIFTWNSQITYVEIFVVKQIFAVSQVKPSLFELDI